MAYKKKIGTVKIHAPLEFRRALYQLKAENPDKTLQEIMKELAKSIKGERRKQEPFWGKL